MRTRMTGLLAPGHDASADCCRGVVESTICTAAARLVRQAGQARTARTKACIASVVPAVGAAHLTLLGITSGG